MKEGYECILYLYHGGVLSLVSDIIAAPRSPLQGLEDRPRSGLVEWWSN